MDTTEEEEPGVYSNITGIEGYPVDVPGVIAAIRTEDAKSAGWPVDRPIRTSKAYYVAFLPSQHIVLMHIMIKTVAREFYGRYIAQDFIEKKEV